MMLDEQTNYIVSGLERSGTSLLMQILHSGGIPIGFDDSRKADEHNPKGYYELEGGKIINKLRDGTFPLQDYRGKFIKITAYGLQFLPPGKYVIIYSERNLDEILDSMEKMTRKKDPNRDETKKSFEKLNVMVKKQLTSRQDMKALFVSYNDIVHHPEQTVQQIFDFLGVSDLDVYKMIAVVDKRLYRQRRQTK